VRHVVIMAGGSGTRFWPRSRSALPKQFLAIGGERTLLRQTADRVASLVGPERLWVVTGALHREHARAALPELPEENLLVEPVGRNTAPCIAWATQVIAARDPDARVAVLPADHFIGDVPGFVDHLEAAFEAASDAIVTFGIVPDRPETGYGYIQRGERTQSALGRSIHAVTRFVEKPDFDTARGYLEDGGYLWNSGMFVFPAGRMLAELHEHCPDLDVLGAASAAGPGAVSDLYPSLPSISIDYAVMERSRHVAVIPASFRWSDVGSWDAARDIHSGDEHGNVVLGDALLVGTRRSMVDAQAGRLVAVVGLEDVLVVDTADALLVIRRGESQDVKRVVEALKASGRKELL
jgi:mannose-1-phosphate guanylyltransferase